MTRTNFLRCGFCGRSAHVVDMQVFVPVGHEAAPAEPRWRDVLRCWHCGEVRGEPTTLSTLRANLAEAGPPESCPSIACELVDIEGVVPGLYGLGRPPRRHDPLRRGWVKVDNGPETVERAFVDVAATLRPTRDYDLRLYLEVRAAHTLTELALEVERLFVTLRHAFRSGWQFEPTEVHDADHIILGGCPCGALPGHRHMPTESDRCPFSLRNHVEPAVYPVYWGRWEPLVFNEVRVSARAVALLRLADWTLLELARVHASSLGLALGRWRRSLRRCLGVRDGRQLPMFELMQRQPESPPGDELAALVERISSSPTEWMRRPDPNVVFGAEPFESPARAALLRRRGRRAA